LSPRSTNVPPRTKVTVKRAKQEQENAHMQKTQTSKNHAPPPPPLVTEPGENGESYATGAFLGKGGFAVCYEGRLSRNGRIFALKVVKSEMNQRKMAEKVWLQHWVIAQGGTRSNLFHSFGQSSRFIRK
jgi:hypothetical protein